jgi:hypothetical protein
VDADTQLSMAVLADASEATICLSGFGRGALVAKPETACRVTVPTEPWTVARDGEALLFSAHVDVATTTSFEAVIFTTSIF